MDGELQIRLPAWQVLCRIRGQGATIDNKPESS